MERRILIVDDEEDIRDSLAAFLNIAMPGLEVQTASSGMEGIERLKESRVDAVLSDYKMPGMNGIEFLAEAQKQQPGAARIMITAFATPQIAAEATKQGGVVLVVAKPFDLDYFVDVIRAILARSGQ